MGHHQCCLCCTILQYHKVFTVFSWMWFLQMGETKLCGTTSCLHLPLVWLVLQVGHKCVLASSITACPDLCCWTQSCFPVVQYHVSCGWSFGLVVYEPWELFSFSSDIVLMMLAQNAVSVFSSDLYFFSVVLKLSFGLMACRTTVYTRANPYFQTDNVSMWDHSQCWFWNQICFRHINGSRKFDAGFEVHSSRSGDAHYSNYHCFFERRTMILMIHLLVPMNYECLMCHLCDDVWSCWQVDFEVEGACSAALLLTKKSWWLNVSTLEAKLMTMVWERNQPVSKAI